jgi:hypothetical protein
VIQDPNQKESLSMHKKLLAEIVLVLAIQLQNAQQEENLTL